MKAQEMTAGDFLAQLGTDAVKWAAEMAEVFKRVEGIDLDPSPGGLLHGWLCNAIEAGRSAGYGYIAGQRDPADTLPAGE